MVFSYKQDQMNPLFRKQGTSYSIKQKCRDTRNKIQQNRIQHTPKISWTWTREILEIKLNANRCWISTSIAGTILTTQQNLWHFDRWNWTMKTCVEPETTSILEMPNNEEGKPSRPGVETWMTWPKCTVTNLWCGTMWPDTNRIPTILAMVKTGKTAGSYLK